MKEKILVEAKLIQTGLTPAQAKIYYALLKRKKATIKMLAEESGYHRTNIYDIIDELKEKGAVTYYKEGKSTYFLPSNPHHLIDIIEEKKAILMDTMPFLDQLFSEVGDTVSARIYRGEKGMKSAFMNLVKKDNITLYGLNIKGQLREQLPIFAKQFYRLLREKKIKYRGIYTQEYGLKEECHEIRYIEERFLTPVATHIYENTLLIQVWSPILYAIEIQSKQIADAYKNHFELIWKGANKKP